MMKRRFECSLNRNTLLVRVRSLTLGEHASFTWLSYGECIGSYFEEVP